MQQNNLTIAKVDKSKAIVIIDRNVLKQKKIDTFIQQNNIIKKGHILKMFLSVLSTFKNRASYIQDGRTATLRMLPFIHFFNKYKY